VGRFFLPVSCFQGYSGAIVIAKGVYMKYTKSQLLAFKVRQAVGSMAIEGISVSRKTEAAMLKVASGRVSGKSVREELVEKYRQAPPAS